MNSLSYKGFNGSISFSDVDHVYYGKIEDIDALVNYEGNDLKELEQAFQEAVDDYIIYCEEEEIPLHHRETTISNIVVKPEIYTRIANLAEKEGITISHYISDLLNRQIPFVQ